jgi:hypothetical protein
VQTPSRSFLTVGVIVVALLAIAGVYFAFNQRVNGSSPTPVAVNAVRPQTIVLRPADAPTPTPITSVPSLPGSNLFASPNDPAYVPGQGFSPDAQRVLDITTLRIALEKYRVTNRRYPQALVDLFPAFAPIENGKKLSAPPVDPQAKQPYTYAAAQDGSTFQLAATLSSGKQYSVTSPTH